MEASGVAQFAGGPEDRRLRLVLLGPLSDQRLFCGWELASRTTATFPLRSTLDIYSQASDWGAHTGSARFAWQRSRCYQQLGGTAIAWGFLYQTTCSTGPTRKTQNMLPVSATPVTIAKAQ